MNKNRERRSQSFGQAVLNSIRKNVYYSIKGRYTVYLVLGVLAATVLVEVLSVFLMFKQVQRDMAESMNLHCRVEAEIVNDILDSTLQSVKFMQDYAERLDPDFERLKTDEEYTAEYCDELRNMYESVVRVTEGSMDYFFRLNPDYYSPTGGFLYSREFAHHAIGAGYSAIKVTDFSKYDRDDDEVKWMYTPLKRNAGTWISPYWSHNLEVNMISYVEPVHAKNGEIVGVVGMDVDFDRVVEKVMRDKVYKSGSSFLIGTDGAVIRFDNIYSLNSLEIGKEETSQFSNHLDSFSSKEDVIAYTYNGVNKRMVFFTLDNDMKLVMVANADEIFRPLNVLILIGILTAVITAIILAWIGYRFTERLTNPLESLVDVAREVEEGNLNLEIPGTARQDEVGKLARAFEEMTEHLQQYVDYVQNLAYKDALTDVQNKAAYDQSMEAMDVDIRMGRARFAIIMIDLNYLKRVNDTYGHEVGNRYILTLCSHIIDVFAVETVYRIGGDEFVVLVKGDDYEKREELMQELMKSLGDSTPVDPEKPWVNVSAAVGMSEFDPDTDDGTEEVFKRADEAMYHNKLAMKASRE